MTIFLKVWISTQASHWVFWCFFFLKYYLKQSRVGSRKLSEEGEKGRKSCFSKARPREAKKHRWIYISFHYISTWPIRLVIRAKKSGRKVKEIFYLGVSVLSKDLRLWHLSKVQHSNMQAIKISGCVLGYLSGTRTMMTHTGVHMYSEESLMPF